MNAITDSFVPMQRINRWNGIIFLTSINLVTFLILPVYICYFKVHASEIALFVFYVLATSFSITMGYHRFFAHSTFKAGPVMEFLLLFFGAATFEGSALKWSSFHRRHHQYTDTELDPHNIKKGFFFAHMGWILFWKHAPNYDNVKDLQKMVLVIHQHRHYQAWAIVSGVILPLLVGALTGHMFGAFLWSVVVRMTFVFHSAFFINSFAHTFGSRPYDRHSSAKDNWLGALLTNGEGYHNFHHRFPQDYRNGIRWYHWDPTKWMIWSLSRVGMVRNLRRTSIAQIIQARLAPQG